MARVWPERLYRNADVSDVSPLAPFQPGQYSLDWERLLDLPVGAPKREGEGTANSVTVGEILANDGPWREWLEDRDYKRGWETADTLLQIMLELRQEGVDPEETSWYCYDHDHKEMSEGWLFFVTDGRKIVREKLQLRASIEHYSPLAWKGDFDPTIFLDECAEDDEKPEGWSDAEWAALDSSIKSEPVELAEATARVWYRAFYRDTLTGQIMAARKDAWLFYVPESQDTVVPKSQDSQRPDQTLQPLTRRLTWIIGLLAFQTAILIVRC